MSTESKLDELRSRLLLPLRPQGALLVVYPPEDELKFAGDYSDIINEVQARGIPVCSIDLRTLLFDVLEERGLLEQAFVLDADNSRDLRQNLAGIVQREALSRVRSAAMQHPDAVLFCTHTASLYPWVSYSDLLGEVESVFLNTLVIPFPGSENGPELHFLGAKDGYNYRAARV